MKNQIVYILPGIFLLINAWYDIRKRKILLHSIWIFTVLWILFLMFGCKFFHILFILLSNDMLRL